MEQAVYTHGHHASVTKNHALRTLQNSASFLIPYIKHNHHILDVGCGPGSITIDIAERAHEGRVVGCDIVASVLKEAKDAIDARGVKNITVRQIDANTLPFDDGVFDITFCHQVLQHAGDPVGILKEMRRVTKPGGIVAAREADNKSFAWYPELEALDEWAKCYQSVTKANGAEPNAGRYLISWAQRAGFRLEDVDFTWSVWNRMGDDAIAHGHSFADRVLLGNFAASAKQRGLADDEALQRMSQGWKDWLRKSDRFIIIPNGEIICRV